MTKTKTEERSVPWSDIIPTGPVLRPADAAEYLGIRLTSYYGQARKGFLPAPIRFGSGRATGIPRPWLDAVIADRVMSAAGVTQ